MLRVGRIDLSVPLFSVPSTATTMSRRRAPAFRHGDMRRGIQSTDSLPSPTFWGSFFGKSLDRALSFCFISTDERRSSSQGAKATSPRTARSDRDPARFAIGSPDLPSPRLPEVPPGRRPPGLGPHGGLSRRTDAPVHGSRRTQGAGPAVAAKLSKVAGQVGSDLRAQSRIVRSRPLGYFFELGLFHH